MKKVNLIKVTMVQLTLVASILLVTSCTEDGNSNDTKAIAEDQNDDKFDNNKDQEDAQFLVNAAEINLEGIHLGQLAQRKGTSAEVKELGKMMADAHATSQKELAALAKRKMVTIPTSATADAKDEYEELDEKNGDDFDKAYVELMVEKHEDAIEKFEDASNERHDSDIKNWATASLPTLHKHLEHSIKCRESNDKTILIK